MKIGNVKLTQNVKGHVMQNGITHVLVSKPHLDECVSLINENDDYGATVGHYHGYDNLQDVDFLSDCRNLTHLNLEDPFKDLSALNQLENLHTLRLHPKSVWHDFSRFPQLTVLTAGYGQSFNGLAACRALDTLKLRHVNAVTGDLSDLLAHGQLRQLALVDGQIQSLSGIEKIAQLECVELSYMNNLTDLNGLLSLAKLQSLELYSNANAVSVDVIRLLLNLRVLKIFEGGDIANLRFIQDLPELEELSFVSTDIIDGDMSPLMQHPTLRRVSFLDKSHYCHQFSDINAHLAKKL